MKVDKIKKIKIECDVCNGSGMSRDCPDCDGSGLVQWTSHSGIDYEHECELCDGSGIVGGIDGKEVS